jgi:P27 family predicted phage terminase small subunit
MLPFLSEPAQEAWGRLAPVLSDMKVLTVADAEALGMLCETAAEYWQATDVIARRGMTYEVEWYTKTGDLLKTTTEQRPEVRIRSDAAKRLKSLMEQFGLTPSARAKLTVAPAKADPLEDYLKGRKSG